MNAAGSTQQLAALALGEEAPSSARAIEAGWTRCRSTRWLRQGDWQPITPVAWGAPGRPAHPDRPDLRPDFLFLAEALVVEVEPIL